MGVPEIEMEIWNITCSVVAAAAVAAAAPQQKYRLTVQPPPTSQQQTISTRRRRRCTCRTFLERPLIDRVLGAAKFTTASTIASTAAPISFLFTQSNNDPEITMERSDYTMDEMVTMEERENSELDLGNSQVDLANSEFDLENFEFDLEISRFNFENSKLDSGSSLNSCTTQRRAATTQITGIDKGKRENFLCRRFQRGCEISKWQPPGVDSDGSPITVIDRQLQSSAMSELKETVGNLGCPPYMRLKGCACSNAEPSTILLRVQLRRSIIFFSVRVDLVIKPPTTSLFTSSILRLLYSTETFLVTLISPARRGAKPSQKGYYNGSIRRGPRTATTPELGVRADAAVRPCASATSHGPSPRPSAITGHLVIFESIVRLIGAEENQMYPPDPEGSLSMAASSRQCRADTESSGSGCERRARGDTLRAMEWRPPPPNCEGEEGGIPVTTCGRVRVLTLPYALQPALRTTLSYLPYTRLFEGSIGSPIVSDGNIVV
ncbi:unnamed protein product [Nesidiocoris tenuis]|uniref:Uncharacterized protein n=1 Tax=Nesidiocoris tenuis TaxID=355587 RepID=A0A6H5GHB9_9HEMI|nr:unnamed protein product [Nesidiocoris tenuis]